MPETSIDIKQTAASKVLYRQHVGPYWTLGPLFQELRSYMVRHGQGGPLFARYLSDPQTTPGRRLRTEIGFFVTEPVDANTPYQSARWPDRLVAYVRTDKPNLLLSQYDRQLRRWAKDHDYEVAGALTEIFRFDGSRPRVDHVEIQLPIRPATPRDDDAPLGADHPPAAARQDSSELVQPIATAADADAGSQNVSPVTWNDGSLADENATAWSPAASSVSELEVPAEGASEQPDEPVASEESTLESFWLPDFVAEPEEPSLAESAPRSSSSEHESPPEWQPVARESMRETIALPPVPPAEPMAVQGSPLTSSDDERTPQADRPIKEEAVGSNQTVGAEASFSLSEGESVDRWDRLAEELIPDDVVLSPSQQVWLGQVLFRIQAVGRGVETVSPGQGQEVLRLARVCLRRFRRLFPHPSVDPLSRAVVRLARQEDPTAEQQHRIVHDLDVLLVRIGQRSISPGRAQQETLAIVQRVRNIVRAREASSAGKKAE